MTSDRPTVVYIASYGHSGSTLLDLLISSHPQFDNHSGALFDAVRPETGCFIIVDSSKQPDSLRGLLRCRTIDLRVILLTRHPCGVVYSCLLKGRPLILHGARRRRRMALTGRLVTGIPQVAVRYEQLASRPSKVMKMVMDLLDLSFRPDQLQFGGRTRHNIGGNRMRFDRDSTIAPDLAWQRGLSVWQKALIRGVSAIADLGPVNAAFDGLKMASLRSGSRE